ncbi:MAG TPA: PAS domain S-box protein [Terriglobales bacterium]|nr:PAS domain S-box protein [Terriglobales bacterium]
MSSTELANAVAKPDTTPKPEAPSRSAKPRAHVEPRHALRLNRAARLMAIAAVVICLVGLAGSWAATNGITPELAAYVGMNPTSAVGMLLCGFCVVVFGARTWSRSARDLARYLSLVPITLAAFTLLRYLAGSPPVKVHAMFAHLMPPNTAGTLLILGISVGLLSWQSRRTQLCAQFGSAISGAIGLLALLGYSYRISALYGVGSHASMTLPAALALTLLSASVVFLTVDYGFVALLAGRGTGSIMLRRMLPLAILSPWIVGWVAAEGINRGWYQLDMSNATFALVLMAILSTFLYTNAISLNRIDQERETTQELLRRNSDQWQATFDCMSEGLSYHDVDYNVVGANDAFRKLTCGNYVEGAKCYETVHGTTAPPEDCPMRRTLETGQTERSEIYEPLLDKHLLVRTDPVRDTDGHIFRVVHVVEDVTERKKAEDKVRRLAAIVEQSGDAIFSNDLDGVIQTWNHAAETIYGYSAEEAIGKTLSIFCPPESPDEWKRIVDVVRQGERVQNVERLRVRKDGTFFHASLSVSPLRDSAGRITGCSAIARDVTEKKEAAAEIARRGAEAQRARAELDAVVDSMGEGLYQLDAEGRVVFMNAACENMLGYKIDEIRGQPMHDLIHSKLPDGSQRPAIECPLVQVMKIGETYHEAEDFFVRKDGSFFPVEYTSSPLRVNGAIAGAVLSFRDISDRKRAEAERSRLLALERQARREVEAKNAEIQKLNAELEDRVRQRTIELEVANKELEAFSYSVSHDLRAPLRSLDGFSHILLDEYRDKLDEEGQDFLRRLRSASQHMGQLIDSLLQLSRVSRSEMSREPVNLSAMAQQIVGELQKSAPDRQVTVTVGQDINAMADPRLTHVILQNLLHNAWKFTAKRADACIEFGTTMRDGKRVMFVRDNGAGFDMNYSNKLFGAFQRLHAASDFEGSGIGLATVQRVVRRHGGKVWAEGAPEQGATFYFTLC